jgi:L-ascorbate metabolism protein UlaG (beta-lactamase superfamily)
MGRRLSSCALVLMQMEYCVDSWTKKVNMVMFAQFPFYHSGDLHFIWEIQKLLNHLPNVAFLIHNNNPMHILQ